MVPRLVHPILHSRGETKKRGGCSREKLIVGLPLLLLLLCCLKIAFAVADTAEEGHVVAPHRSPTAAESAAVFNWQKHHQIGGQSSRVGLLPPVVMSSVDTAVNEQIEEEPIPSVGAEESTNAVVILRQVSKVNRLERNF